MFGKSSQTCAECAEFGSALLLSPLRHAPHRTSAPPGSHLHTSNEQGPSHPCGLELSDSILDLSDRPGRLCGHVVVHNLDRPAAAVK